ncbi:MAG TPA: cobyrinate a,c-diamide synthase [Nitrospiraceae bacterium]|nr:cobyrinate a,c-diamide synthase [Nitrospiraceae bacterium]
MNGFIIAGTHSGCGKTTITLGLLAALKKKGLKVQPFKAGPDFIDSGIHRLVTGRYSRNLDIWMCGEEYVKECFYKYSADADLAIVEGVMGMYDGEYSTAKLAGLLNLPVFLVVDAYGMAESAGAVVKGFREYGSEFRVKSYELRETDSKFKIQSSKLQTPNSKLYIAGVIFNRVASDNHFKRLKDSAQDVTVLGYLPRDLDFEIPHRHLGLTVAEENPLTEKNIGRLADAVLRYIDIDRIVELTNASIVPSFPLVGNHSSSEGLRTSRYDSQPSRNDNNHSPIHPFTHSPIIAIAYDKAFCFYYEDNLDLLKNAGAEIITFSPLSDSVIPDTADAIYIGGGYPELYARELSENTSMMKSINDWAIPGKPIYAECGGLMYLSKGIYDFNANFFEMAGVFPFETEMKKGRSHLGYREIILKEDCILGKKGNELKGHEFHYSEIRNSAEAQKRRSAEGNVEERLKHAYSVTNGSGKELQPEGYRICNTLASYIHIHFGSDSEIAWNFLNHVKEQ